MKLIWFQESGKQRKTNPAEEMLAVAMLCFCKKSIFGVKPAPGLDGAVILPFAERVISGAEKSAAKNLLLGKISQG